MTNGASRAATLRKFNPGAMQSDEEITRQFVVRTRQFDAILEVLRENLDASSNQHLLVVAPRGRGKTMLLARIAAELRTDENLATQLLPVRFMEESMEVLGIADFWLECLLHLSITLNESQPDMARDLRRTHEDLAEILEDKQLEQRARAAVLNVADRLGRRLVLMVENLQDLASDTDKDFGWQLRKILQNEPRIMLIASTTCRFSGLDSADQPFFELFREIALPQLNEDECQRLWEATTGQSITTREIKPLKILTGGSPRLLIFIAGFSHHHSMRRLMEELVTLIDDHTEYFRGHLDTLAPKERRVYLALIDLWQPSTAREIAQRARMDIRPASSLLGRLVKRGAVTQEPQQGKQKYYGAAERLYSIYYKLRRERNEPAVVQGLVLFMTAFYTGPELKTLVSNLVKESKELPEIRMGLQLAMRSDETARERLISQMTFDDCCFYVGEEMAAGEWTRTHMFQGIEAHERGDYEATVNSMTQIINSFIDSEEIIYNEAIAIALEIRGSSFAILEQWEQASSDFTKLINLYRDSKEVFLQRLVAFALFGNAKVLAELDRPEEAIAIYEDMAKRFANSDDIDIQIQVADALLAHGEILGKLGKTEESITDFTKVIKQFSETQNTQLLEKVAKGYFFLGQVFLETGNLEKAENNFAEIIKRFNDAKEEILLRSVYAAILLRGNIFIQTNEPEKAITCFIEVIERLGNSNQVDLQRSITSIFSFLIALKVNHEQIIDIYTDWCNKLPIENPEILSHFQATTVLLYKSDINPSELIAALESAEDKKEPFRPLIIALRQEMGEKVRAPAEILEVAEDVRILMQEAQEDDE